MTLSYRFYIYTSPPSGDKPSRTLQGNRYDRQLIEAHYAILQRLYVMFPLPSLYTSERCSVGELAAVIAEKFAILLLGDVVNDTQLLGSALCWWDEREGGQRRAPHLQALNTPAKHSRISFLNCKIRKDIWDVSGD